MPAGEMPNHNGPIADSRSGALDYSQVNECLNAGGSNCSAFDVDGDNDVDMIDVAKLDETMNGCFDGSPSWANYAIAPQTGKFTFDYFAMPVEPGVDALTGLSQGPASSFADSAVTLRFNVDGYIDARNENIGWYEAENVLTYVPGENYHFRVVVDIASQTYSAYVRAPDSAEVLLATNYKMRTNGSRITQLNYWHLWSDIGSHRVCTVRVLSGTNQPPDVNAGPDLKVLLPQDTVALHGTVTDDGFTPSMITAWVPMSGPGPVYIDDMYSLDTSAHVSVPGTYVLRLLAHDGELWDYDDCTLTVASNSSPVLSVSPTVLDFGATTQQLSFDVWNSGSGSLSYTISETANWLNVTPTSGQSTGEQDRVTVTVDRAGLLAQLYQANITIQPSDGAAQTVQVRCTGLVDPGNGVTPIARWDVVPYQRINAGETFKCGVVAFSKGRIQRVTFRVNSGSPVSASAMTYNDRTDVYEYWFPIRANDFATAGTITVQATVYGWDGGTRVLDPLTLVVNPGSALPAPQAWVATNGNDSTGQVDNSNRPYASIGKAMEGIRLWMQSHGQGSSVNGGIVRLQPGRYDMSNGGVWTDLPNSEWVTVTTAAGGTRANTFIDGYASMPKVHWLKVEGVTVEMAAANQYIFRSLDGLWLDDCSIVGAGWHTRSSNPVQQSSIGEKWYTDTYIYNTDFGIAGGTMARGVDIEHIGEDAFQHCPMIVNCTATDVDPGTTGWHSDAWQWFSTSGPKNTIAYNYRFEDGHCQGLMCRTGVAGAPSGEDVAFVNCYIEVGLPNSRPNGPVSLWMRSVDHFILWNCSFVGHPLNIYDDDPNIATHITNFDVRGCYFDDLRHSTPLGNVDFSSFDNNHYRVSSGYQEVTPGTNVTIGNPALDAYGRPLSWSVLVNRLASPVPCDADNVTRDAQADVGAYEH